MINVTTPFLPNFDDYVEKLKSIWQNNWLTNNGPLVNELELKLKEKLGIKHLLFLNNGTIALQIAIHCLNLTKKIITTPFSYVATTSCILWEKCEPVFVDIDKHTFNIDENKIEKAIDDQTEAILATHVFGNPCNVEKIDEIAKKYNLKVIYDAAHAFNVNYKNQSILNYGDISTVSFHATKLFHTIEGGAVATTNTDYLKQMALLRNFGHDGPDKFSAVGINGKNNEFSAAMGLCNLDCIDEILSNRKEQYLFYAESLKNTNFKFQKIMDGVDFNYAYFPIVFESENLLLKVLTGLNKQRIFPRRYFYPSLNKIGLTQNVDLPIAESIAKRILCLPLAYNLSEESLNMICRVIKRYLNN